MTESFDLFSKDHGPKNTLESKKLVTREEVLAAYKKFVEKGIENPDDLDLNDPEVNAANKIFDEWCAQEKAAAKDNEELQLRTDIASTMFYVDAGFTDPKYLDEVLNDWLAVQMHDRVEKQSDDPERTETRRQLATAIRKVKELLKEAQSEI